MSNMMVNDFTPQERAGIVVWHMAQGEGMRTRDVASMTGLTHSGALKMMYRLSRRLPFYQDDDGFWQVCFMQEICLT